MYKRVHRLLFAARTGLNIKSLWFRSYFNWQRNYRQLLFYTNSSFLFGCTAKNTVVSDPYKAFWQYMQAVTPYKVHRLKMYFLFYTAMPIVFITKSDLLITDAFDTMVADGYLMSVSA
jgi:hypothetical protein